eukprot:1159183-Pelagomonas_calceolata.AAC.30
MRWAQQQKVRQRQTPQLTELCAHSHTVTAACIWLTPHLVQTQPRLTQLHARSHCNIAMAARTRSCTVPCSAGASTNCMPCLSLTAI